MTEIPSRQETRPKLLLIELNEFAPDFLAEMSLELGLRNIGKMLALPHAVTATADLVEHQGLDPWVQWVGVHCGRPTTVHGVRRLGETRRQTLPQIWQRLGAAGYSWGVFGVMNAPRGDAPGCDFFFPDPWSFEEDAYPKSLNDLLALPRYVSKNYLSIGPWEAFKNALKLARFFAPPQHWLLLTRFGAEALRSVARTGPNVHTFTTLLDYLSTLYFVQQRRRKRPDFSLIFLNHIAHLQHQFWNREMPPHPEMALGLELNDAMIGLLLQDRRPDEALVIMNGLKQKNVAGEGFHVYRQKNPQAAALAMGLEDGEVKQSMTHDAHILFSSSDKADRALAILQACTLSDGHHAFYAERAGATRVFYQIDFEHRVAPGTRLMVGNRTLAFDDLFELVCERTGAHVPDGDVYFDGVAIPPNLENHEIFGVVMRHFGLLEESLEPARPPSGYEARRPPVRQAGQK